MLSVLLIIILRMYKILYRTLDILDLNVLIKSYEHNHNNNNMEFRDFFPLPIVYYGNICSLFSKTGI